MAILAYGHAHEGEKYIYLCALRDYPAPVEGTLRDERRQDQSTNLPIARMRHRRKTVATIPTAYPASLSVDYPERSLDRLSTFFRPFVAIPILIVLGLLSGGTGNSDSGSTGAHWQIAAAGLLFAPVLLMLLFRQKYPRWWFDWNVALTRFSYRVSAYMLLLRDEYPSTDEEQAVHVEIQYPNARELNRWLPLVKWFLAIPHIVVLFFLSIAAAFCVLISWFAILFTGQYPRSLFGFVVGVSRWWLRVSAYAVLLTTDVYPPFTLGE
jgi:hypothetical protein